MNEIDKVNSIEKNWGGLVKNVNLPKSNGKYEYFHGLVFYLFDLHIATNISGGKNREEQIINLVDKLIKNSPELYAILQRKKIENDTNKWNALKYHISEVQNKLNKLNEKEELTKEEKKERKVLVKEESRLIDEFEIVNKEYKIIEAEAFKDVSETAKQFANSHSQFYVILGGDFSDSIEDAEIFYHRLREWLSSSCRIMAVLGNHELKDFSSVDAAVSKYQKIFNKENIILLQNNGYADFFAIGNEEERNAEYGIKRWPDGKYYPDNLCFFGGIGFNKYDKLHNANNIVTSMDLQGNVAKEVEKCEEFIAAYNKALEYSWIAQKVLVVITHYPLRNWLMESECENSCYYFCGHNHKNELIKSNGAYVFADNQIGYQSKEYAFRYVDLLGIYNPFYCYEDGVYSIAPWDYQLFYRFIGEGTIGIKKTWKYVRDGYELKMIKKNGYYGFFIVGKHKVFICMGGGIKGLNKNFDYYCNNFEKMVNKYIEKLTPYRNYQIKLSEEVKKIGGSGNMHGLIVDYDFCHHIMISPTDNSLFLYYSPLSGYGTALNLKSVIGLLDHVGKNKITKTEYLMNITTDSILYPYIDTCEEYKYTDDENYDALQIIDIKNSPYAISIRMRNLERVFTSGVLRDWDDAIINDFLTNDNDQYLGISKDER